MAKKAEQVPVPDWYPKLEAMYMDAVSRKREAETEIEKLKDAMLTLMETDGIKSVDTDLTQASYTSASVTRKFNSTDFKKDYPQLYEQYATKFQRAAYVQVKLKTPNHSA